MGERHLRAAAIRPQFADVSPHLCHMRRWRGGQSSCQSGVGNRPRPREIEEAGHGPFAIQEVGMSSSSIASRVGPLVRRWRWLPLAIAWLALVAAAIAVFLGASRVAAEGVPVA